MLMEMRRRMSAGGADGRRRESVRRDGSWNQYPKTRIESLFSFLFHRKERKVRKDIVTLTLRLLRCSIS